MPRTKPPQPKVAPAPHRVIGRASATLRAAAQKVRQQVARERAQIAAEADEVIREAEAAANIQVIRVLFQKTEQDVLEAIDRYARRHGLGSRVQVARVALRKLLKIENGPSA